jgi:hypothetical protein
MCFTDVYVGWPGSVHDNRVLLNSPLSQRAASEFSDGSFLLGDAGYAPQSWLVPAFRQSAATHEELLFNAAHSRCRVIVERAFGILKGRWRLLQGIDMRIASVSTVSCACCILHNICVEGRAPGYVPPDVEPEEGDSEEDHTPEDVTAAGRLFRHWLLEYMLHP